MRKTASSGDITMITEDESKKHGRINPTVTVDGIRKFLYMYMLHLALVANATLTEVHRTIVRMDDEFDEDKQPVDSYKSSSVSSFSSIV